MSKKMFLATLLLLSLIEFKPVSTQSQFCWKDAYGRGAGSVPTGCGDKEKLGALCYENCPSGMKRVGVDCHSICPDGMRDDGLFCRKAEYSRGAGYGWKLGDKAFSDKGQYKRCEKDHGSGNCEKSGAIVYPKCKPGYYEVLLVFCRPSTPDCRSLNLNGGIDLSCGKRIELGKILPNQCEGSKEKHQGLCYEPCKWHYRGVGPVCWAYAPPAWVDCGMGASLTQDGCVGITLNQIQSVAQLAVNVASMGAPSAANVAQKASMIKQIRFAASEMKRYIGEVEKFGVGKKILDAMAGFQNTAYMLTDQDDVKIEDAIRQAAELASLIDPTGVAGAAATFIYPKCPKPEPPKPSFPKFPW